MRIKKNYFIIAIACFAIAAACTLICACGGNDDGGQNEEKTLTAISLDTTNATLVFDVGDEFSYTGLMVNAVYSDNSIVPTFASDCTVSVPVITQKGTKTVTVTYGDKSAEYEITVRELLSISVDAGTATTFSPSDDFDYSGITVTAHYADGIADSVIPTGQYTVSSPDMSACGQKTVTVTYKGKTVDYTIKVENKPAIYSAELREADGSVGLVISGAVTGYTKDKFGLDLQKLGSADTVAVTPEVTLGEDGAFEIYCNLTALTLNYGDDYMIHVFIDGTSYDVVDIQTPADDTLKRGDIVYEVKSEQWFSNNTSYFVVLRCGNEEDLVEKTVTVNSATVVEENGGIYLVVSGEYTGNYSQNDFVLDVEDTVNWSGKTQLNTTATLDNGALTVRAEITSLGACRYITHLIVGGNSMDIKNIQITEVQLNTDVKNFEFNAQDIFNNNQDYYATITVEYNAEPSYAITGATLGQEDGKVYYTISGTCEVYTENDFSINLQETFTEKWSNPELGEIIVTVSDGEFAVSVDITDRLIDNVVYITHLVVNGEEINVFEISVGNPITVNNKTYTIENKDVFGNGNDFYVTITVA